MEIDETARRLIRAREPVKDVVDHVKSRGMRSLLDCGLATAAAGVTTLAEVVRVLQK